MQDMNFQDHEDDGLAFMQKHGAHGWQQQFEVNDDDAVARTRSGMVERSVSQEMMFGAMLLSMLLAVFCSGLLATPTPTPDNRSHLLRGAANSSGSKGEATQKLSQQAQQAKELVRKQAQIDEEVQQR
eukprot:scaffold398268_cov50-Prasinocladus_malaysianus.AAC.2